MSTESKTVPAKLEPHVHSYLVKLTGEEMVKTGRRVSISKVIEIALQIPSPQMSAA